MRCIEDRKDDRYETIAESIRYGVDELRLGVNKSLWNNEIEFRPRNSRICRYRRDYCGDCDYSNCSIQGAFAGSLGQRQGKYQCIGTARTEEKLIDDQGQSTVEFAVIAAGFAAITVALTAFWRMLDAGLIVQHALTAASHHLANVPAPNIADIFRY